MTLKETIKKYIEINNIRYDGDYSELDAVLQDNDIEPVKGGQPPIIVDVQEVGKNIAINGKSYNFNLNLSLDYNQTTYYFFTINITFDTDHTHIKTVTLKFNAVDGTYWTYLDPTWVNFHAVGSYLRLDDSQSGDIDTDYHDGEQVLFVAPDKSALYPGLYTNYFDGEQHLTMRINDGCRFDIFKDIDSARDYYRDGINTGLLNDDSVITKRFEYFIKNTVYKNGKLYFYRDYKFTTSGASDPHSLVLYKTDGIGYDYILKGQSSSTIIKILSRNRSDGANEYAPTSSADTEYLKNDQTTAGGNEYTVSFWRTNIHCFNSETDADGYITTGDTSNATNNQDVNRANDTIVDGHIGDVVSQTDNGTSGISFAYGGQIYALSSVNLAQFFTNVLFSTDTDIKNAILEGTQLFGTNQINAINGCMYLPITDISDIASVSSVNKCFIGTYEAPITANRVVANDKMINCGSAPFNETYGDYRDYEPYCKLGVLLPYIGFRELSISRYINKTVSLKYAVDVTTGACTAYLYANGVIMDSFDGTMGVQRPLTAVNQQAQVSAVINGILGTATQAAKTVGTAGTAAIGAAALSGASSTAQAMGEGAKFAGSESQMGGGVVNTVLSGYNTLQAALDPPMSTRGAYSGVLGQFANQYPYFIFSWLKTSKPENEIETVGLPSNAGGTVGSFGGYLKCSAFNLANGFGGTQSEANEIIAQMMEGVYVS